jgi:hypothetical protein
MFAFFRQTMDTIETISEELMEFRELIETLSPLENYLSPPRNATILMVRRNLLEQGDPVLLA